MRGDAHVHDRGRVHVRDDAHGRDRGRVHVRDDGHVSDRGHDDAHVSDHGCVHDRIPGILPLPSSLPGETPDVPSLPEFSFRPVFRSES